jgi:hypothetical protein
MILEDQEENPAKSSVVCGKGSHWGTLPPGTDVQNLSALTTATLSGPAAGLVGTQNGPFTVALNTATSTSVTVNLASNNGSDTFQATLGGGNVTSITIPAGSTTVTFYLTPGGTAGNRGISITTSPSLTYSGSPIIFDASSITIPAGSTSATFYLTPGGTAGNRNISITTSPALTYSGSPITYTAAAGPTSATLSGPTSGIVGVESTAFTVTVNQPASTGGVTVTPASSIGSDTFQATSGGGNVLNVSEINFGTQGGTVANPAPTALWTFQPTDTAKGPWVGAVWDTLFSSTHDSALHVGYNFSPTNAPIVSGEPIWRYSMEQDYYVAASGTHCCEAYQEFSSGSTHIRPWQTSINRATGAADILMDIGPSGDANYGQFSVQSSTNTPLFGIFGGGTETTYVNVFQGGSTTAQLSMQVTATQAAVRIGESTQGILALGSASTGGIINFCNGWWLFQNANDTHLYLHDQVNSIYALNFYPGSTTATAIAAFYGSITAGGTLKVSGAAGFNGATPPSKAADPGTATGTDAAVINAITTILKNLGFCS